MAFCALVAAFSASLSLSAQQTSGTFRWIDFHSRQDQNIVAWVTRSLAVANWTAIREIGVEYDAALVVTSDRADPQAAPGSGTFTVWSASLTSHAVVPLVTGIDPRWLEPVRFREGGPEEWPLVYDNCRQCAPNTYFTAFYYDARGHAWSARWLTGGHGLPIWNADHPAGPAGVNWTQAYALLPDGEGHVALYTWNHFDYGEEKSPEDFLYRYDVDPFSGLDRMVLLSGRDADAAKLEICGGEDAVQGFERGADSSLCREMPKERGTRRPVTTPPANNRGQSLPPGRWR